MDYTAEFPVEALKTTTDEFRKLSVMKVKNDSHMLALPIYFRCQVVRGHLGLEYKSAYALRWHHHLGKDLTFEFWMKYLRAA